MPTALVASTKTHLRAAKCTFECSSATAGSASRQCRWVLCAGSADWAPCRLLAWTLNSRPSSSSSQGLDSDLDLKRILKAIKKRYNCNGNIKNVKEYGEIIQVQGDQRANIKEFLLGEQIYESEDRLVLHGF